MTAMNRWTLRTVRCAAGALCGAALWIGIAHAQPVEDFALSAELTVPANAGLVRARVPTALVAGLRSAQGADLRVVNGSGAMLPFAMVEERATQTAAPLPPQTFKGYPLYEAAALGQQTPALRIIEQNGQRMVELASSSAPTPQQQVRGLLYDTRGVNAAVQSIDIQGALPRNTLVHVSFMSSHDLKDWQPVALQQPLFQFDEGGPGNSRIRLTTPQPLNGQYLRLTWDAVADFPDASIALEFAPTVTPRAPATWPLGAPTKQGDDFAEWALPARYAVQALRLQTVAPNALMPVRVLTRERDADPWRLVAQTVVYRLPAADGAERSNPPLAIVTGLASQLRVEPARGYSLTNSPVQLALDYTPMQVVFVATGAAPFRLLAGANAAQALHLPLATVVPGYQPGMEDTLPDVPVDAVQGQMQPQQEAAGARAWLNQRTVLWAVLIVAVLVLAAVALSLLRAAPPAANRQDTAP